ncbi:hypothetical protein [Stenotrophomonas sp.]|uniref:hypothetical protein n=1 Tax=Stenotrophomonas sp. TaxID=69392 RepID=UPI00289CA484|nr:hypothetical protein [Stenotrophomonas sp.]
MSIAVAFPARLPDLRVDCGAVATRQPTPGNASVDIAAVLAVTADAPGLARRRLRQVG